jgi:DNA-binding transcriptional MerR regulator
MFNLLYFAFGKKSSKKFNPRKKKSGTRKYTSENILTIQYIYHLLKEKGMTIEGAKKQLQNKSKLDSKEALLARLEVLKASLISLKEKM